MLRSAKHLQATGSSNAADGIGSGTSNGQAGADDQGGSGIGDSQGDSQGGSSGDQDGRSNTEALSFDKSNYGKRFMRMVLPLINTWGREQVNFTLKEGNQQQLMWLQDIDNLG